MTSHSTTPRRYSDHVVRPGPLQCSQACRSRPGGPGSGTPTSPGARKSLSGHPGGLYGASGFRCRTARPPSRYVIRPHGEGGESDRAGVDAWLAEHAEPTSPVVDHPRG